MKLYFAPDACSLAPHIVLRELDLPFALVRIDNRTKRTAEGGSFYDITPKGYVAALMLDSGEVLTEGPAIVQYLADLRPAAGLAPPNGTWTRVRLQEWLNFITSEIHAGSAPLFSAELPEAVKSFFKRRLFKRFEYLVDTLRDQPYLLGAQFSVADAYLYTVLRWMKHFSIDLRDWPCLQAFFERVDSRPAVKTALAAEAASPPVEIQD
jgi:glutathione S-transferase